MVGQNSHGGFTTRGQAKEFRAAYTRWLAAHPIKSLSVRHSLPIISSWSGILVWKWTLRYQTHCLLERNPLCSLRHQKGATPRYAIPTPYLQASFPKAISWFLWKWISPIAQVAQSTVNSCQGAKTEVSLIRHLFLTSNVLYSVLRTWGYM